MPIDSRIALGTQAPDANRAVSGGLLNAQAITKSIQDKKEAPLRNKLLEAQVGAAEAGAGKTQAEADQLQMVNAAQSVLSGVNSAETLIDADDFDGLDNFTKGRIADIEGRGGDSTHTKNFAAMVEAGPQEDETPEAFKARLKTELRTTRKAIYDSGLVERPAMGKEEEAFIKGDVDLMRTGTKDLKKRAGIVQSNFNKIERLKDQMSAEGALPRSAINLGIMAVARMMSPGVVTDKDASAVAGVADPVQAATNLFDKMIERGGDAEKIQRAKNDFVRSFDPANPETFNADAFIGIAKSIGGAEASTIQQEWEELKNRGERGGLSKRVMDANFGGENKSISGLSMFLDQGAADMSTEDIEVDSLINKYTTP